MMALLVLAHFIHVLVEFPAGNATLSVRDGIYKTVADYNSTWRVSSVRLSVPGQIFERFELES